MKLNTCRASAIGSQLAEDISDPRGTAPTMLRHIEDLLAEARVQDMELVRRHGLALMMHATKHSIDEAFEEPVAEAMFNAFSRDVGASYHANGGDDEELQRLLTTMNPVYERAAADLDRSARASGVSREFCKAIGVHCDEDYPIRKLVGEDWSGYAATVKQFLDDVPMFCNVVAE